MVYIIGMNSNSNTYNSILLKEDFEGIVFKIFIDKQDHATWKIVLNSGKKVPVEESWLSVIEEGDSVYKCEGDSFLFVVKKHGNNEVKIKYTID